MKELKPSKFKSEETDEEREAREKAEREREARRGDDGRFQTPPVGQRKLRDIDANDLSPKEFTDLRQRMRAARSR